jgi:flagellar hook-length control protein FliK
MTSNMLFITTMPHNFGSQASAGKITNPALSKSTGNGAANETVAGQDDNFLSTLRQISNRQQSSHRSDAAGKDKASQTDESDASPAGSQTPAAGIGPSEHRSSRCESVQAEDEKTAGGDSAGDKKVKASDILAALVQKFLLTDGNVMVVDPTGENNAGACAQNQNLEMMNLNELLASLQKKGATLAPGELQGILDRLHFLAAGDPQANSRLLALENLLKKVTVNPGDLNAEGENKPEGLQISNESGANAEKLNWADILKALGILTARTNNSGQSSVPIDPEAGSTQNDNDVEDDLFSNLKDKPPAKDKVSDKPPGLETLLAQSRTIPVKAGEPQQNVLQSRPSGDVNKNPLHGPWFNNSGNGFNQADQNLPGEKPAVAANIDSQISKGPGATNEFSLNAEIDAKVVKTDAGNNDPGLLFASSQFETKTAETLAPSKASEMVQPDVRSEVLNQIVQKAVLHFENGQNEARLDLKPDFLGHIQMQIITDHHQVSIRISTEFPFVKDMLENNAHQLRLELQQQGLEVDELEVFVAHDPNSHGGYHHTTGGTGGRDSSGPTGHLENTGLEEAGPKGSKATGSQGITVIDYFA